MSNLNRLYFIILTLHYDIDRAPGRKSGCILLFRFMFHVKRIFSLPAATGLVNHRWGYMGISRHISGLLAGILFPFLLMGEIELSTHLQNLVSTTHPDSTIEVVVTLQSAMNTRTLLMDVKELSRKERRSVVLRETRKFWLSNSAELMNWLYPQLKNGNVKRYKSLWISNSIVLEVFPNTLEELRRLETVKSIHIEHEFPRSRLLDSSDSAQQVDPAPPVYSIDDEWGVDSIGTRSLWNSGIEGQNVVIGCLDTGVDIFHPDLEEKIWTNRDEIPGNGIDDDQNGYVDDVHGYSFAEDSPEIMDDNGHGTLSAGILVAQGERETGVAPQARLMILRNWPPDGEGGTESTFFEAVQYAVENGADIISSSMSFDWVNDPDFPDYETHRYVQQIVLAAGIIHVNSTGNNGNSVGAPWNLAAPSNCPPPWLHPGQEIQGGLSAVLAVGAINPDGELAFYSDIGPCEWFREDFPDEFRDYPYEEGEEQGLIKPDLVAPTMVTSTQLNGGYTEFVGTSASTPHVGGALALLMSAHQQSSPEQLTEAIKLTAMDLGTAGLDSIYGAGFVRVDFAHAWLDSVNEYGHLFIAVTDPWTDPARNADVLLDQGVVKGTTDNNGELYFPRVLPGQYILHLESENYPDQEDTLVTIEENEICSLRVVLSTNLSGITPERVVSEIDISDTLTVPFGIPGGDTSFYLEAQLAPRGGFDWIADSTVSLSEVLGNCTIDAIETNDDTLLVAGSRAGEYWFWRLNDQFVLVDSFPQVQASESGGIVDLAVAEDGSFFATGGSFIFRFDQTFQIADTIGLPFDDARSVAYDPQLEELYVSQAYESSVHRLSSSGEIVQSRELLQSPLSMSFCRDENGLQSLYLLNTSNESPATLSKWLPVQNEIMYVADLSDSTDTPGLNLCIDRTLSRPQKRFIVLDTDFEMDFFGRGLTWYAYDMADSVLVHPNGAFTTLTFFGPEFQPGTELDLQINWKNMRTGWEAVTPIHLVVNDLARLDDMDQKLPETIVLYPPYPNPFNSIMTVSYQIEEPGFITLQIFNLLGQKIGDIYSGHEEAGTWTHTWTANNLSSGLYFVILESGQYHQLQKVMFVK